MKRIVNELEQTRCIQKLRQVKLKKVRLLEKIVWGDSGYIYKKETFKGYSRVKKGRTVLRSIRIILVLK